MQKDYNGCNYHTFKAKTLSSLIRVLKSKKKKLALTSFYCLSQAAGLDDSWKLINIDQLRFYNLFHVGKFKMFNINSKCSSIFNKKPLASWVTYMTRDFLTCYSVPIIVSWLKLYQLARKLHHEPSGSSSLNSHDGRKSLKKIQSKFAVATTSKGNDNIVFMGKQI